MNEQSGKELPEATGFNHCVFLLRLRAGSDAYPGVIYEKLKFAYEILDKMVLPYHLRAPSLPAKLAFSA
jgi:hypothetical protein